MRNLKRALSLTLASVMLLGMMVVGSSALSFNDADDISNVTAATVLEELGVMQGDGQGNFMPEQTVTRAQMAILICRILYGDKLNISQFEGTTQYTDVAANAYYTGYINLATQLGIIAGYGDGRFGPDDTVTTAQAALMLSRALGYFKANELATGDWALASVAQATKLDMFGGLKLGTNELLARDNVCEMVFNAMTKAVPVQYSERWDLYYTDSTNILGGIKFSYDETLAYRNFDLVYNEDNFDGFNRPVTEWGIGVIRVGGLDDKGNIDERGSTIKTSFIKAVNEADLTYTKKVKVADIYKDLGLAETIPVGNVQVYVDGGEVTAVGGNDRVNAIRKNDTTYGYGGNGVLTQVYYFPGARTNVDDKIIITEVNTYIGQIIRTVPATSTRETYVEIGDMSNGNGTPHDGTKNSIFTLGTKSRQFETNVSYADEDKVLYTYSLADNEIKTVKLAETANGTVNKVVNKFNDQENSSVTVDGTEHKAAKAMKNGLLGSISVNLDYTVYLDEYGYAIAVSEEDYTDYALVSALQGDSSNLVDDGTTAFNKNQAQLVLTDGTVKVVTTDKNYVGSLSAGTIITYKEKSDGTYILKAVTHTGGSAATEATTKLDTNLGNVTANRGSTSFSLKSDRASIATSTTATELTSGSKGTVYADSKTIFVVYNRTDKDWAAYTGIKNAPTIASADLSTPADDTWQNREKIEAYWYCKGSSAATMTTVMYIIPGNDDLVKNESNNMLFLAGVSGDTVNHDDDDYVVYQGIINGEVRDDIKISTTATFGDSVGHDMWGHTYGYNTRLDGLYSKYSTNREGDIITSLTPYQTTDTSKKYAGVSIGADYTSGEYTIILAANSGTTVHQSAAENSIVNGSTTLTLDNSCKFYNVDVDGNVTELSALPSMKSDVNHVYYIAKAVADGEVVTHLIVEDVETKTGTDTTGIAVNITSDKAATVEKGTRILLTANVAGLGNRQVTSYQWYVKVGEGAFTALTNETTATYAFDAENTGKFAYRCDVTVTDGKSDNDGTVTGNDYNLTVNGPSSTVDDPSSLSIYDVNVMLDSTDIVTIKGNWDPSDEATEVLTIGANKQVIVTGSLDASDWTGGIAGAGKLTVNGRFTAPTATGKVNCEIETRDMTVKDGTTDISADVTVNNKLYIGSASGAATLTVNDNKTLTVGVGVEKKTSGTAKIVVDGDMYIGNSKNPVTSGTVDGIEFEVNSNSLYIYVGVTGRSKITVGTQNDATKKGHVELYAVDNTCTLVLNGGSMKLLKGGVINPNAVTKDANITNMGFSVTIESDVATGAKIKEQITGSNMATDDAGTYNTAAAASETEFSKDSPATAPANQANPIEVINSAAVAKTELEGSQFVPLADYVSTGITAEMNEGGTTVTLKGDIKSCKNIPWSALKCWIYQAADLDSVTEEQTLSYFKSRWGVNAENDANWGFAMFTTSGTNEGWIVLVKYVDGAWKAAKEASEIEWVTGMNGVTSGAQTFDIVYKFTNPA